MQKIINAYLELPLSLDAMVNILDDFYDEEMTQKEKAMQLAILTNRGLTLIFK